MTNLDHKMTLERPFSLRVPQNCLASSIQGSMGVHVRSRRSRRIPRALVKYHNDHKRVLLLAAMSSSRSDVVTQCVRLFVRSSVPFFFLLLSLKFYLVLKSFNGVSRKLSVCFKFLGVLRKLQRFFKEVLRVFQGKLNCVLWNL